MANLFQSSSTWTLSLKILLISSGVLSMAVIFKLSVPVITGFAVSDLPLIWSFVVSWLRPPYLYLLINCIIIIIVASSRLQSKFDESSPPTLEKVVQTQPVTLSGDERTDYQVSSGGSVLKDEVLEEIGSKIEYDHDAKVVKVLELDKYVNEEAMDSQTEAKAIVSVPMENDRGDEFVISKSSWAPMNKDPMDISFPTDKPLVSARFGHRRVVKASPEGGKTLGVSKSKRNDTLESTWKTITEGRPMPLTRHLRKADMWETHGHLHQRTTTTTTNVDLHQKMTKSETFDDRGKSNNNSPSLSRSRGAGKLRKEPSPGQEELNRRVEAFIKKFNEDMRLQRQESLNQYLEMINRGVH